MVGTSHQKAIETANIEIANNKDVVAQSNFRLTYHFMAPVGWINDPNGLIQYDGEYHLFFQYNPYEPFWGPMHWGHAKSNDLINWEHLPVALAPSEEDYDFSSSVQHGCFSGTAVKNGEKLTLIYTGHVDEKKPMQVQCIAESYDGINFKKYEGNPVIGKVPIDGSNDFRDPKVWRHNDLWYMIVGTKKDGKGKIVLYTSVDLKEWTYIGVAAESNGTQGDMWECPDLFPINDSHILILSPMYGTKNTSPIYIIGDMDYAKGAFSQGHSARLDYGFDFYAPQTLLDDKGRRILVAWMDMWFSERPTEQHGWAGAMTIPRELVLDGDMLKQRPIEELTALRTNYKSVHALTYTENKNLELKQDSAMEIVIEYDINETDAHLFGIQVRVSADGQEKTEILLDIDNQDITLNRNHSGVGPKGICKAPLRVKEDGTVNLQLFLDTTSIELFVNDGESVMTSRIYPDGNSNQLKAITDGGKVSVNKMETWTLKE